MLRIIILVIAITAGSLAGWLALSMRPGVAVTTAPASAPQVAMIDVLVASSDLGQGQTLNDKALRWQPWPATAVSPGFITRSAQPEAVKTLAGAMVRMQFVSGEPIREDKLSRGSNLLASLLTPGKRAVAIRVSVESTAGGFILPNDRVDVLQTVARPGPNQTDNLSRTILTNIRVLAVDQKVEEAKGQAATVGKTATLELSPSQAEAIASGQASGLLSLSLRSVADNGEEPVLRPESASVRILRAGQSEVVKF
ncbi:Flp pilus assembly protein CpaB [Microvirga sp. ACRRW]|uniref:Flp pilus assembly protein CpaB n=1 Tax=Microvirga sp. ACRRW TaxID=2918205 RepID=UPI001EF6DF72|nr:Flp pilus assembly protein CpaB [Microvirga sp. ACRRW]MCG7391505.1 Flp pilus assembly protein CpaB [Microvirga sp. ACRRW]